ncbi:MAG TPA: HAD family hydrolase [Pseudonocardiaceae bacterium]
MNVRAVVFDYFGTLTPTLARVASAVDQPEIAAILGVDRDAVTDWWSRTYPDRSTGRTGNGLDTMRLLARTLGGDDSDEAVRAAQAIRLATYATMAQPRANAVETLTTLRAKGLRIGLLSDCSAELPELWPDLPLAGVVDEPVFSALVGERKPHPKMYTTVCERLGVPPGECLYIGDGGSNELTGATAFGMRAVLIADAGWATGHRFDSDDWHGETITDLTEVPSLLTT